MKDADLITATGTYKNDEEFQYELWVVNQEKNSKTFVGSISYSLPEEAIQKIEHHFWRVVFPLKKASDLF